MAGMSDRDFLKFLEGFELQPAPASPLVIASAELDFAGLARPSSSLASEIGLLRGIDVVQEDLPADEIFVLDPSKLKLADPVINSGYSRNFLGSGADPYTMDFDASVVQWRLSFSFGLTGRGTLFGGIDEFFDEPGLGWDRYAPWAGY
jgi:hypothetical protein